MKMNQLVLYLNFILSSSLDITFIFVKIVNNNRILKGFENFTKWYFKERFGIRHIYIYLILSFNQLMVVTYNIIVLFLEHVT